MADLEPAEEIELRRHIQRVAAQRRALPPGGEIARDLWNVLDLAPGGRGRDWYPSLEY